MKLRISQLRQKLDDYQLPLPQLAACAFHQYRIAKKEENGRTQTEVLLLDYEERIGELARIMGGLQVTDTVRKAAEELLKGAVT